MLWAKLISSPAMCQQRYAAPWLGVPTENEAPGTRPYHRCVWPCSSVEKKQQLALPAGVTAGIATMMAHPLAAEATSVTPSLRNLLGSVAAGGAVLAAIIFAVSTIASFDPVARGRK